MSAERDGNTIKYSIEIDLANLEAIDEAKNKLRDTRRDALSGTGKTSDAGETEDEKKGKLRNLLGAEGLDSSQVNTFFGMAKNPNAWLLGSLRALPVIGGLFIIKEIAEFVYDWLTGYGRPLDIHFKRVISEEIIKNRSRAEREQIRIGNAQVIFTHESGSNRPQVAFNSLVNYRDGSINDIDIFRIRSGRL